MRVVVLVDGEHYPPVVRSAIEDMRERGWTVAAAVYCGGGEKVRPDDLENAYGVPVARGEDRRAVLRSTLEAERPDAVIDLSDEPVLRPADRFVLANEALSRGIAYLGSDFELRPPPMEDVLSKPSVRVIATGKRTGKTAVAGALARHAAAAGRRPVIVCMGRGGPEEPVVLEIDRDLSARALLDLVESGHHAASDYIEDALTSRVTTIGCRRVGGGLAGAPYASNVLEGARIAEDRDEDLVILEGSGAAVPPVRTRTGLVCVPATAAADDVRGYLAPLRLLLADLAVVTMADDPAAAAAVGAAIREVSPELEVVRAVLRPKPLADISGRKVFYACTAPKDAGPVLAAHLAEVYGCEVVAVSHHLADRAALQNELDEAPDHDVLVTEIKAGAVDVAVRSALARDLDVVFADNDVLGDGVGAAFDRLIERAEQDPG
jgi:cyclic 2,3-diphosphoglycerate synthase